MRHRTEGRGTLGLIGGALLLLVGGLFVLQNPGLLHAGRLGDYWPLFLVWIGLCWIFGPRRPHHVASGVVLFLLGVLFQLDRLDLVRFHLRDAWPVFLVVAGASLIADALIARRTGGPEFSPRPQAPGGGGGRA